MAFNYFAEKAGWLVHPFACAIVSCRLEIGLLPLVVVTGTPQVDRLFLASFLVCGPIVLLCQVLSYYQFEMANCCKHLVKVYFVLKLSVCSRMMHQQCQSSINLLLGNRKGYRPSRYCWSGKLGVFIKSRCHRSSSVAWMGVSVCCSRWRWISTNLNSSLNKYKF